MTAQSFEFFAGEDVSVEIPIVDNDGDPVELVGVTARFVAAPIGGSLVIDSEASPPTATATVGATSITVDIADTDTDSLLGSYRWELKLIGLALGEKVAAYGYMTAKASLVANA